MWASWCKRQKTKDEPRKLQGYLCITWPSSQPGKRENMREDNESQWWTQYSHSVQFIKKKKKRSWQKSKAQFAITSLLYYFSPPSRPLIAVSFRTLHRFSFSGEELRNCLCAMTRLCVSFCSDSSLFLRSTAKAGFIIYNYKHKK